jgi:hypothetical protein
VIRGDLGRAPRGVGGFALERVRLPLGVVVDDLSLVPWTTTSYRVFVIEPNAP